ncbi:unnamed protein product [Periconia digitata]|uniref:Uncharacterized protein n=1 Tax=Periconia digitata TaxID=1303443 RepID=A0A9W4U7R5_9PLEO|nr:unnamed protein product [Periconia digitata]
MPKTAYDKIALLARVPSIYLDTIRRSTAMQVHAMPRLAPSKVPLASSIARKEYLSFIICSIPSHELSHGASFTYHFPTRHMDVFLHCRNDFRWGQRITSIERNASELKTPFLIPSLLIRHSISFRLMALDSFHERIYQLERKLNIRYDEHSLIDFMSTNFEMMTKDVNKLSTNLGFHVWAVKSTRRELDFLDGVAEKYYDMAVNNGGDHEEAEAVKCQLLENQAYLRSWNKSIEERAEYLSKRAQALVQTVYSGIAQRDAALSQGAAILAARDSSIMRIITAITIIFLPATTTATFFSTTFFDFAAGPDESVYSWWLWLYWVVTIGLTALVLLGAILWWKKKEGEIMALVGTTAVRNESKSG